MPQRLDRRARCGETTVTWTATDTSGNIATSTQSISVVDTTAPEIIAPVTVILEATSLSDNLVELVSPITSDEISAVTITNDAPDAFSLGDTIITWSATDDAENTSTVEQKITILDTSIPIITIPDDIVIEATAQTGNVVVLGNATANDLVEVASVSNDAPDLFSYGETIVTWTATDTSGNSVTSAQSISVVDTTTPSINAPSDIVMEAVGIDGNTVDIGAATADDIIQVTSVSNDAPNSFSLGDTIITWTATDQDGNSATSTQKITLVDTTHPELTAPEDIIIDAVELDNLVVIGNGFATDLIDDLPIVTNDAPDVFPLGQTIITWSAVDAFGNSVNSTQIVNVQACGKDIDYYNMITGTFDDDLLVGTNVADLIFALGGDDIVIGDKGNDCIFGGEGDDILYGNEGNDQLIGDEGNDVLKGHSGDDKIIDGTGLDVIDGGDDNDQCIVEELGNDIVIKCES